MTGLPGNILNIVSCVHMVSWGISGEIHLNESEDDRMGQGEKHVLHVVAAKTPPSLTASAGANPIELSQRGKEARPLHANVPGSLVAQCP